MMKKILFLIVTSQIILNACSPTKNKEDKSENTEPKVDSTELETNLDSEVPSPIIDLQSAAGIIHESFHSENDSLISQFLNSEKDLKIIISHSISEAPDKEIVLKNDEKINYFTSPIKTDEFPQRGESKFDKVKGNRVYYNLMLLHNTHYIKELEFSDDEYPQLILMKIVDGD